MTTQTANPAIRLRLDPILELDDDQLFVLCERNRELRIERDPTGELQILSPSGGRTSSRNAEIVAQLLAWAKRDGRGQVFDSSGGFLLPDGAMRSPDAGWIENARLEALSREERERFLPLCPTFVVELRSPSDALGAMDAKMREYVENGARLGWLVDPVERRLHVYRPGADAEVLDAPAAVAGDPVLPGFVLDLAGVWDPGW